MRASGVRLLQKGRRHRRTILRARKLAGSMEGGASPSNVQAVITDELLRAQAQAGAAEWPA